MIPKRNSFERDARVMRLYDQLLEIEQRLIPTGLHVFGAAAELQEKADLLRMVASFDRPEHGTRAMPKLVAEALRIENYAALLNDPEVIFLDEPMSGLDPLGRRDVRALILELRDQGRTVFFSSHILSDAEALCRRVAVVARGRLAAVGKLSDILAFAVRGWELIVFDVPPDVVDRVRPAVQRVLEISPGRYTFILPMDQPPDRLLSELVAGGAKLVSLNPLHDTLEDFFLQRVAEAGDGARAAGEGARAGH